MSTPPSILKESRLNISDQLYITDDGHKVRSRGEALIDNWLYHNDIQHAYEKAIPVSAAVSFPCDFYLPKYDIYLEYWGIKEDEKYQIRRKEKEHSYKVLRLTLFSVENKHLRNLDRHMNRLLVKVRIQIKDKKSESSILTISEIKRLRSVKRRTLNDKRILGTVISYPVQKESSNMNPYSRFYLQIQDELVVVQVWGNESVENVRIAQSLSIGDEILIRTPILPRFDWGSADIMVNEELSKIFRLI